MAEEIFQKIEITHHQPVHITYTTLGLNKVTRQRNIIIDRVSMLNTNISSATSFYSKLITRYFVNKLPIDQTRKMFLREVSQQSSPFGIKTLTFLIVSRNRTRAGAIRDDSVTRDRAESNIAYKRRSGRTKERKAARRDKSATADERVQTTLHTKGCWSRRFERNTAHCVIDVKQSRDSRGKEKRWLEREKVEMCK